MQTEMRERMPDAWQCRGGCGVDAGEACCERVGRVRVVRFRKTPQARPHALRRTALQQYAIVFVPKYQEHDVLFRQRTRRPWRRNGIGEVFTVRDAFACTRSRPDP